MLFAWGSGSSGQLGLYTQISEVKGADYALPQQLKAPGGWINIDAGGSHSLGITEDGLFAWGCGECGQLGIGTMQNEYAPQSVKTLCASHVKQIAGGWEHSLALTDEGEVVCWGSSKFAQIGSLAQDESTSPPFQPIPRAIQHNLGGTEVVFIACGMRHSAFITREGNLFTFGYGRYGELGHGDKQGYSSPKLVERLGSKRVHYVACGWKHTVCATEEGEVYAWGNNTYGQLGFPPNSSSLPTRDPSAPSPTSSPQLTPTAASASSPAGKKSLGPGGGRKRVIVSARSKSNPDGCMEPHIVEGLSHKRIISLACGWTFTVALAEGEGIYTFGRNNYGQLGRGDVEGSKSHIPTLVQYEPLVGSKVVSVVVGSEHVLALNDEGKLFGWGWNEHGNLGLGDLKDRNVPCLIEAFDGMRVVKIAAGGAHSLAIVVQ